jgi:predicted nuclease of predicted toxin-antitoxin system
MLRPRSHSNTLAEKGAGNHLTHILLDENMPKSVKEWLKRKGFTATSVQETNLKVAKDIDIVKYAQKNKLAILTMDTDFAQIYYNTRPKDTFTVIVVKAKPATPANIIETLNAAQKRMNLKEIQNKLVIITKKRIRIIS